MKYLVFALFLVPNIVHANTHHEREHQFLGCLALSDRSVNCVSNLHKILKKDIANVLDRVDIKDKVYALNTKGIITEESNKLCLSSGLTPYLIQQCVFTNDLSYLRYLELRFK